MALGSTRDRTSDGGGIYIGTVTRVDGAVCYVECPRYAPGFELGPAPYPSEYAPPADNTPETGSAGSHGHGAPTATTTVQNAAGHDHGNGSLATGGALWADTAGQAHTHNVTGQTGTAGGHGHDATTTVSTVPAAGSHSHSLPAPSPPLAKGDRVAVAFLENSDEDVVVLVRLA